jgi:hypothetical protein
MTDRRLIALFLMASLMSCDGATSPFAGPDSLGGAAQDTQAAGTLFLTGRDTDSLGTTLEPGDIAFQFHSASSRIYTFVVVDEFSSILEDDYIAPDVIDSAQIIHGDPENSFVLRLIDDELLATLGVQLDVVSKGVSYTYACNAEGLPGVLCSGLFVDRFQRTLQFGQVKLLPVGGMAAAPLLLNGEFSWTGTGF